MANKAYQISFSGTAVEQSFYGDVVSLVVEENTTTAGTFHIQLAIRLQDDGSWKYLDDDRLALFNEVTIQDRLYPGRRPGGALGSLLGGGGGDDGLKTVFDGYITDVDLDLGSDPDHTFLNVSGMDTSVLMSLEEKIATWPDMADSDIAQQIVANYGVPVRPIPRRPCTRKRHHHRSARRRDIQFVRDLAQRNGLEFYFETDKTAEPSIAYFRAPQLSDTPQPDLAIQFGDQSNLKHFLGAPQRAAAAQREGHADGCERQQPELSAGQRYPIDQTGSERRQYADWRSTRQPCDAEERSGADAGAGAADQRCHGAPDHRAGGARRGRLAHHRQRGDQ